MPETPSPARSSPCRTGCGSFPNHPPPNFNIARIISTFVLAINELEILTQPQAKTGALQCSSCPALTLLDLAAELIDALSHRLYDVPAADCPAAASFNLANTRPSPPAGQGNPV